MYIRKSISLSARSPSKYTASTSSHTLTRHHIIYSIENYTPDILLTDINLPGLSGIEAVKKLRANNFSGDVVFVTSTKKYALDAWELSARQYLVKPVTQTKIFSALSNILHL